MQNGYSQQQQQQQQQQGYGQQQYSHYYAAGPSAPPQQQQPPPPSSPSTFAPFAGAAMPGYPGPYAQQHTHTAYAPPAAPVDALGQSRDSTAGPSRTSAQHRRDYSTGQGQQGQPAASSSAGGAAGGAGARHPAAPYQRPEGAVHNVKASSTTSLFTTRKNWSEHLLEEIQDFMHVLSPTGNFIFASASAQDLVGYSPEELFTQSIFDFIHPDDVQSFRRDFDLSCRTGDTLTLYYRFKARDTSGASSEPRFVLFEVTGHPYYEGGGARVAGNTDAPAPQVLARTQPAKAFFAMARPYPSKNQAMLDSFLELKFENERLRQELLVMYKEVEGDGSSGGFPYGQPGMYRADSFESGARTVIDPATGLVQTQTLIPSTSNTYGALGIGISANGTKGDGTNEKKKKKARVEEGEFVCRDCGTVESPEWRKGPEGPKSLCNACGLRYAKLVSKSKKEAREKAALAAK
ncbi:white collar 2 type of transcription factor [Rhodotorula kratochvilovae]